MNSSHPDNVAATPPPGPSQCGFDPNFALGLGAEVIRNAASGDFKAQQEMRSLFADAVNTVDIASPFAILFGLEMVPYARLCAA